MALLVYSVKFAANNPKKSLIGNNYIAHKLINTVANKVFFKNLILRDLQEPQSGMKGHKLTANELFRRVEDKCFKEPCTVITLTKRLFTLQILCLVRINKKVIMNKREPQMKLYCVEMRLREGCGEDVTMECSKFSEKTSNNHPIRF